MDNLTHSLIGFAAVEVLQEVRPRLGKPKLSPKGYWIAQFLSVFTNNLPDLDFLYSWITEGKLGYLLHHRGHTHTLIGALLIALPITAGCVILGKRRFALSASESRTLWGVGLLGAILHIVADSWNSYGVHPFWPAMNAWFYGDSVFILEPIFWMLLLPLVTASAFPRAVRWLSIIAVIVAIGVFWRSHVLLPFIAGILTGLPFVLYALQRWWGKGRTVLLSASLFFVTLALFFGMSLFVKQSLRDGDSAFQEVILSPLPANPFCWSVIIVFEDRGRGEVGYRRGWYTPFPDWVNAKQCPSLRGSGRPTARMSPVASLRRDVSWQGEFRLSQARFAELALENCHFEAFLRFSRAPFFLEKGDRLVMGDLRFDWDESIGFAELEVPLLTGKCPRHVPTWTAPRADWINVPIKR